MHSTFKFEFLNLAKDALHALLHYTTDPATLGCNHESQDFAGWMRSQATAIQAVPMRRLMWVLGL